MKKVFIGILLGIVLAVVPLTLVGCSRTEPIIFTDIITECEKNSNPTIEFTQEFIDYLALRDSYFTVIRFEEANLARGYLPAIYKRTINITNQTVTHIRIPNDQRMWSGNVATMIENSGFMYPKNVHNYEIDEIVTITLGQGNWPNLTPVEGMTTRVRIVRDPVPLERLYLRMSSLPGCTHYIPVGSGVVANVMRYPLNTSWWLGFFDVLQIEIFVKHLVIQGSIVTGGAMEVYIDEVFPRGSLISLVALPTMQVGDKIVLQAVSRLWDVYSNTLTFIIN